MSEQGDIFSSTGGSGTSVRQDGRLYHNAELFHDNPNTVEDIFYDHDRQASTISRDMPDDEGISRVVFRGLVSQRVLEAVADGRLREHLEIAMPVEEFGQHGWLIYLAKNHPARQALMPVSSMVEATSEYVQQPVHSNGCYKPLENVKVKTTIEDADQKQLLNLWGPTFGWSEEEVSHLAKRLDVEKEDSDLKRSVWFSALVYDKVLASAAMAERLTLPGRDRPLDLVESTEWRTRPDLANRSLMTQNLIALNSQVTRSLEGSPNGKPLIYAECNFTSRSDRAGYKAGFRIPARSFAAQIAIQNVTVNDEIQPRGLRDFTFMYTPQQGSSTREK